MKSSNEKEKSSERSAMANMKPESSFDSSAVERSAEAGSMSLQEQNKKRTQKARMTADFLRKLPEGITYHESCSSGDDEPKQVSDLGNGDDDEEYKEGDIVRVGKFRINIEKVTKAQLISMRKFLPATQYRLIKNRKTARLCRRKRKEERGDMQRMLEELRKENLWYKIKLEDLEKKFQESERARVLEKELSQAESLATMSNMMAANQNVNDPHKGQLSDNVDLNELIRNALRRGSVASNFIAQQQQHHATNPQETHSQIQRQMRTLSLPNIYNPRGRNSTKDATANSTMMGQNPLDHGHTGPTKRRGHMQNAPENIQPFDTGSYHQPNGPQITVGGAYEGENQSNLNGMNQNYLGGQNRSPSARDSNQGLLSVSRMFHRQNLRSLSLASVSDLTKAQIANYVNQFINGQQSSGQNPANDLNYLANHRNSVGHLSHHPPTLNGIEDLRSNQTVSLASNRTPSNFNMKDHDLDYLKGMSGGQGQQNQSRQPLNSAQVGDQLSSSVHQNSQGCSQQQSNQQTGNNMQIYQDELMRLNAARQSGGNRGNIQQQPQQQRSSDGLFGNLSSYQFGQAGRISNNQANNNSSNSHPNAAASSSTQQKDVAPNSAGGQSQIKPSSQQHEGSPGTNLMQTANGPGPLATQRQHSTTSSHQQQQPMPPTFNNVPIMDHGIQQQNQGAPLPAISDSGKAFQVPGMPQHHMQAQGSQAQKTVSGQAAGSKLPAPGSSPFIPPHLVKQNRSQSVVQYLRRNSTIL